MEKVSPPPYSEAAPGYPPQPNMQPGFVVPPNQPQPYPGQPNQPQPYPGQPNPPQGCIWQRRQRETSKTIVMIATSPMTFGPNSQPMTCPHCHHQITTRVETESSSKTHLFAVLLCIVGCIPCCLIPYCTDSCQNRNHYCPSCSSFLGAYTN